MKKVAKYIVSKDFYHLNKKFERSELDQHRKAVPRSWHNIVELHNKIKNAKTLDELNNIYASLQGHISLSPMVYDEVIKMLVDKKKKL